MVNPPRLVQSLVILSCGVFSTVQNHHFWDISWICSLQGLAKQDLLSVEFSNFLVEEASGDHQILKH